MPGEPHYKQQQRKRGDKTWARRTPLPALSLLGGALGLLLPPGPLALLARAVERGAAVLDVLVCPPVAAAAARRALPPLLALLLLDLDLVEAERRAGALELLAKVLPAPLAEARLLAEPLLVLALLLLVAEGRELLEAGEAVERRVRRRQQDVARRHAKGLGRRLAVPEGRQLGVVPGGRGHGGVEVHLCVDEGLELGALGLGGLLGVEAFLFEVLCRPALLGRAAVFVFVVVVFFFFRRRRRLVVCEGDGGVFRVVLEVGDDVLDVNVVVPRGLLGLLLPLRLVVAALRVRVLVRVGAAALGHGVVVLAEPALHLALPLVVVPRVVEEAQPLLVLELLAAQPRRVLDLLELLLGLLELELAQARLVLLALLLLGLLALPLGLALLLARAGGLLADGPRADNLTRVRLERLVGLVRVLEPQVVRLLELVVQLALVALAVVRLEGLPVVLAALGPRARRHEVGEEELRVLLGVGDVLLGDLLLALLLVRVDVGRARRVDALVVEVLGLHDFLPRFPLHKVVLVVRLGGLVDLRDDGLLEGVLLLVVRLRRRRAVLVLVVRCADASGENLFAVVVLEEQRLLLLLRGRRLGGGVGGFLEEGKVLVEHPGVLVLDRAEGGRDLGV
ncbi:hypothetical protein ColLi_09542 [Colletotrichum liriopes]|uniref:Uncharacterized protein n=1 Tax=Colletotrichum liriopes TaxID=708192 RepID=A0AA37GTU4_9PEZI|nr:hypothetical protein ColLi_09542 [Colletotrichum liriopes]